MFFFSCLKYSFSFKLCVLSSFIIIGGKGEAVLDKILPFFGIFQPLANSSRPTFHNAPLVTFLPDTYQLTTAFSPWPTLEETNQKTTVP